MDSRPQTDSGNDTNINVHVGFSRWWVTVLFKINVRDYMFTVMLLDSGQCLFALQVHILVCIAHTSAEMAAETSSGPIDIQLLISSDGCLPWIQFMQE